MMREESHHLLSPLKNKRCVEDKKSVWINSERQKENQRKRWRKICAKAKEHQKKIE